MTTPFKVGQYKVIGDDGLVRFADSRREAQALRAELEDDGVYAYVRTAEDALAI